MEATTKEVELINSKLIPLAQAQQKLAAGVKANLYGDGLSWVLMVFFDGTAWLQWVHHGWGEPCLEDELKDGYGAADAVAEAMRKNGLLPPIKTATPKQE